METARHSLIKPLDSKDWVPPKSNTTGPDPPPDAHLCSLAKQSILERSRWVSCHLSLDVHIDKLDVMAWRVYNT